jgi:hypothetical protein
MTELQQRALAAALRMQQKEAEEAGKREQESPKVDMHHYRMNGDINSKTAPCSWCGQPASAEIHQPPPIIRNDFEDESRN